ncbi:MAG: hypothetical protein GY883_22685 [Shimia sp.]|nr:hypothetical protein [Shimia sp.]
MNAHHGWDGACDALGPGEVGVQGQTIAGRKADRLHRGQGVLPFADGRRVKGHDLAGLHVRQEFAPAQPIVLYLPNGFGEIRRGGHQMQAGVGGMVEAGKNVFDSRIINVTFLQSRIGDRHNGHTADGMVDEPRKIDCVAFIQDLLGAGRDVFADQHAFVPPDVRDGVVEPVGVRGIHDPEVFIKAP